MIERERRSVETVQPRYLGAECIAAVVQFSEQCGMFE